MILKKLNTVFVLLMVCMLSIGSMQAQDKQLEKANEAYKRFAFIEAGQLFKKCIEKGNTTVEAYSKLGDCYYFNANYMEAAEAYAHVMESKAAINPEYYFRYAQSLNSCQKYDEAAEVMKTYYKKADKKDLSENWKKAKLMADIEKQSGRYELKTIDINSPFSDFGTGFYGIDKVVYASAKDTGVVIKRKHSWNEKSFLKLYTADITVDGGLANPKLIKGDVNTRYHQSTPAITKDGQTMYFTRSNYMDGKLGADKQGTTYLKIYVAKNIKGEWKDIMELPFPINSDGYSSAHPALSPDGTELYFASDRGNKFGNSDLYVVSLKKDGIIGNDVKKLGDEINTLGRETYPYVDEKGILYFSSDGHPGLGGLDVFAAEKDVNGLYHVVNVGDGVNTTFDDFGYGIQSESKKGFFSSNRSGNDDLYGFTETRALNFGISKPLIFGTIKDSLSGAPIADVAIELRNAADEKIATYFTDKDGKYSFDVEPLKTYKTVYKKPGYIQAIIHVPVLKPEEKREVSLNLYNEMQVIVDNKLVTIDDGVDLTKLLSLKPIYFDYNGYKIRESSKAELDKVVDLLLTRPSISIQVNSHTDSRGKDDFNMRLSENRAKATVDYIVKAGIPGDRVTGKGFGETKLINRCTNGVPCSEAEHQENRRSEFIVIINKKE